MERIISIQGFEGSFHQIAAEMFFGKKVKVDTCSTFRDVVTRVDSGTTTGGVMAIENSIAGSILANYNLLQRSRLSIIGEVYLPIQQHLLVNPGVTLEDIREVQSHPMAIQQCYEFLNVYNWKLVETEDTALSARHIHQHKNKTTAAIAGRLAAELYGLEIVAENIHTVKRNYTRFLVLDKLPADIQNANKASVSFQTDHSKGSLSKVLTKIADGDINLSKLQSFPVPGTDWRYKFHADMEFSSIEQFEGVMNAIKNLTIDTRIFGVYKNGKPKKN